VHLWKIFFGVGGAVGIALAVMPANASPLPSAQPLPSTVVTLVAARSSPQQYEYRGRYLQNHDPDAYRAPRTPEYNVPDAYPTGSSRWWEEMDRQNRGGR
jgi:hypothetical protein